LEPTEVVATRFPDESVLMRELFTPSRTRFPHMFALTNWEVEEAKTPAVNHSGVEVD